MDPLTYLLKFHVLIKLHVPIYELKMVVLSSRPKQCMKAWTTLEFLPFNTFFPFIVKTGHIFIT